MAAATVGLNKPIKMTVMSSTGKKHDMNDKSRISDDQVNTSQLLRLGRESNPFEDKRYAQSEQRNKKNGKLPPSALHINTHDGMEDVCQVAGKGDSRLSISALVSEQRRQLEQKYQKNK